MPPVDFQIGGANRARSSVAPFAVPSGLSDLVAGASDFAAVFAQKAIDDQNHRDSLTAIELRGQYQRQLTERMRDLDPTADDYLQRADEAVSEVQADIMAEPNISSREVLEKLETDLTTLSQHTLVSAVSTRHEKIEEKALTLVDQETDEVLAQIRDDPDGSDAYVAGLAKVLEQAGPSLRPEVLEAKRQELGDRAIEAQVEGLALARRYDDAKAFLKENEGELTPEQSRFLGRRVREIQNTHQQDFHAATDGEIADINIAIIDAKNTSDLRALRERVETMASQGMFEGREQTRVSLIRAIESKRRQLVNDNNDLALALQKYGSGTGVDSQKEADLAYGAVSARYPEDLEPAEKDALDREFIKRAGIVPTSIKRLNENAERVENPALLARAAQQDADIQAVAPGANTGAGPRSEMVQAFHDIGLPMDEAAQLVIDRAPDNATAKARDEQFEEEFGDTDWREYLREEGVSPERGIFSPLTETAEIPQELVDETERVTRMFYRMSGDPDAATAAAVKRLSKVYGTTDIGGAPQLQKFPPERFLQVGDARDVELRSAAMDGLVRRAVEATGAAIPQVEDGSSHRLVTDRQTQREIEQGLLPSYEVRVRSKVDGDSMVPVWVETTEGVRTKLRVRVPTKDMAEKLPEVQQAQKAAKDRALVRQDLQNILSATIGAGPARASAQRLQSFRSQGDE